MRDMRGRVLVTGAAGFAGSHLVDSLIADAFEVHGWYRPGGTAPRDARAAWTAVDLLNPASVRESIESLRPAAIYHCAGAAHVGRSWDSTEPTFAINVRGTHHLIESVRDANLEARILIPGSATVYQVSDQPIDEAAPVRPSSPYALSKLAQEMAGAQNPGGPWVAVARAFNHIGPRQDPWFVASGFARRIADIEAGRWPAEISVGNLEARRDLTDVRDTVRAYRLILEQGQAGRVYNVCSGRAIAIRELLDLLLSRARMAIRIRVDPARYRPNDQPVLMGDNRRIHAELGWLPRIPLEQTLDDLLAYWREVSAAA